MRCGGPCNAGGFRSAIAVLFVVDAEVDNQCFSLLNGNLDCENLDELNVKSLIIEDDLPLVGFHGRM